MLILLLATFAADDLKGPIFKDELPHIVAQYLYFQGLPGGEWKKLKGSDVYFFTTEAKPLASEKTTATFQGEGDETHVKKLTLSLFMFDSTTDKASLEAFAKLADVANQSATGGAELQAATMTAIRNGRVSSWKANGVAASIKKQSLKDKRGFSYTITWQ